MSQGQISDIDIQIVAGLTAASYTNPASVTVNAEGFVTAITSGTAPVLKRRVMLTFYPASTTADTAPNITQVARLPKGTNGVSSQWKFMSATLRVEVPNASATTAQVYYVSSPGNAAFGAGTAALSSAVTASGTSVYEVGTTSFAGTLATTGLPSGTLLVPQFSALGGQSVSVEIECEEV